MPVVELFVRNGQHLEPLPPVCVHSGASNVVYHGVPVVFPSGTVNFHLPLSPQHRNRGPITDTTAAPGGPANPAGVPYSFRIPDASDAFVQALFQLRSRTAPAPSPAAAAPVPVPVPAPAYPQPVPEMAPGAYPSAVPLPAGAVPPYYAAPSAYPPGYAPPAPGYPAPTAYAAPPGAYPSAPDGEGEGALPEEEETAKKPRMREPTGVPKWIFAVIAVIVALMIAVAVALALSNRPGPAKPTEPPKVTPKPKEKDKDKPPPKGGKTKPTEPE
jgi:hypothetical protein